MANKKGKKPQTAKTELLEESLKKVEEVKKEAQSEFEKAFNGLVIVRK